MLPSGATQYSFSGRAYPSVLVRSAANAVRLPAYRSGALVAPTGATYTLVSSTGTLIVDAAACTISGSVATYTIPALSLPSTLALGEGYQERWVFTFSGEAATVEILRAAAVCAAALYPVVADADLTAQYFGLSGYLSGSLTTWQGHIDEAWGQLMSELIRQGRLPYAIRTPDALRDAHLHLTLALIFQGFGLSTAGQEWDKKAEYHRKEYRAALQACTVQLDADGDKLVDDPTARSSARTAVVMAPAASPRSGVWSRV